MTTYTSKLRQFAGKTMKIVDIYKPYRAGGLEIGGKFIFKKFYAFEPSPEHVLTEVNPHSGIGKPEWREVVWVDKKQTFVKVAPDKAFFKTYKKVFDINVELEEAMEVNKYGDLYENTDNVVIQQVSASKVKDLIDTLTDYEVPMVDGKNREGEKAMVPAYDYEDGAVALLKDKSFTFKATGEGLDTKYTYKEKAFTKKEPISFDDIPF